MTVQEIIEDVIHRVGKSLLMEYGEPHFLRALNRIYGRLNAEHTPIIEETVLSAGTFGDAATYDLPARYVRLIRLKPHREYISPVLFNDLSVGSIYTFLGQTMHFTNVDSDTEITLWWYSTGKNLVIDVVSEDDDIATPEWPADIHQLLIYETAMELSADYPLLKKDIYAARKLTSRLAAINYNAQAASPQQMRDGYAIRPPGRFSNNQLDDDGIFDYGG